MKVYFSHTGNKLLKDKIEFDLEANSISELVYKLNMEIIGIKSCICDDEGRLLSSVRLFKNVEVIDANNSVSFAESDGTKEIKAISTSIDGTWENLLISLFEVNDFKELLSKALSDDQSYEFKYMKHNEQKKVDYKAMLASPDEYEIRQEIEHIYKFEIGKELLDQISIKDSDQIKIVYKDGKFDKGGSKIVPDVLVDAIGNIWGVCKDQLRLRLFQEDAMFYIMSMLSRNVIDERVFLLSMPTGGGKTEAFMLPILSDIILKKKKNRISKGIKSLIIYPTKALANDQAMRFVELVYQINEDFISKYMYDEVISIGVLSGDTPRRLSNSTRDKTEINICPRCGNSNFAYEGGTLVCQSIHNGSYCGTKLDFCRFSKEDILDNPPDILITNPDMINYALHSPLYSKLFNVKIDSVVFDEVHFYQGIFGCHIAHLLRRLEERINSKPTYIGLSATIGNAEELAALLFNEEKNKIKYVHNKDKEYTTDEPEKERYHLLVKPAMISKDNEEEKRYIRTISVANIMAMFVGHLITDCHFRKTIIFANYKNDADEMAKLFQERQEFDIKNYFKTILSKLQRGKNLEDEEIEISRYIDRWLSILNMYPNYNKKEVKVGWNRGGLERDHRIKSVQRFILNKDIEEQKGDKKITISPNDVMIATKTLEVGIDIGDVTTVINSSAPFTTNEYAQRVGRAGRKKDSLAITIINPESGIDAFFETYFYDYVHGTKYEDAPIITSNSLIFEKHIYARILDYFAKQMSLSDTYNKKNDIYLKDFISNLYLNVDGRVLQLHKDSTSDEIELYTEKLYSEVFESHLGNVKKIEILLKSFENEKDLLGFTNTDIDTEFVKSKFVTMFKSLVSRAFDERTAWGQDDSLSGFKSVEKKLTPSLRGSGATVDLKLAGAVDGKIMETVPRYRAFVSIPPSTDKVATLSSGVETFNVKGANIEQDVEAKKIIRKAIARDSKAIDYFKRKLDNFPQVDDSDDFRDEFEVVIPKEIEVKHFPDRFYCPSCQKGLIYPFDITAGNEYLCKTCGSKAIQLHSVNVCLQEKCGNLMEPPVPKVCINEKCDDFKKFYTKYKANGNNYRPEYSDHFSFRLTRDLEWVCNTCNTRMNFHQHYKNTVHANDWEWSKDNPQGVAILMKRYPEGYNGPNNHSSNFNCSVNRSEHKKVGVTTVPRVRTIASTYYCEAKNEICDSISFEDICEVKFVKGNIIQLSEKFSRRFTSGLKEKNSELKIVDIFKERALLGNYLDTHLIYINFSDQINDFLSNYSGSCTGDCEVCDRLDGLDLGSVMKPRIYLKSYQMSSDGPNKPDPRGIYCDLALNNKCKEASCVNSGEFCKKFDREKFMKYVILHTVKHGMLWAMPKYAGVNISEIRGDVFPNDGKGAGDLVLYDSNEGGSGAILLVQKNWKLIWNFANELIDNVVTNDANLILPHTCNRFNQDLCPVLAKEFLDYLRRG